MKIRFLLTALLLFLFCPAFIGSAKAQSCLPGDANNDCKVDGVDYVDWLNNYNKTTTGGSSEADLDNSGTVDGLDYVIWLNNYGKDNSLQVTSTPAPTPTNGKTPPSAEVPCSSLSGIERRFPCSPLVAGPLPESVTSGTDAWDMFTNMLYPGSSDGNGINERFSAVANPAGSGVVVRNRNVVSDGEGHTTAGTGRSLPNGSTECSAFRWLWKDATEFPQRDWVLVWQLQMSGSPIVAIHTSPVGRYWYFKSRNGSDSGLDTRLGNIIWGQWAYFVVCTHLADAPNGWTKVWFRYDGWPDVNAAPFYQRSGHDTYQGQTGHNTIGIYAGGDYPSTSYYGYFDRYGRAATPARAVTIAGNP